MENLKELIGFYFVTAAWYQGEIFKVEAVVQITTANGVGTFLVNNNNLYNIEEIYCLSTEKGCKEWIGEKIIEILAELVK